MAINHCDCKINKSLRKTMLLNIKNRTVITFNNKNKHTLKIILELL